MAKRVLEITDRGNKERERQTRKGDGNQWSGLGATKDSLTTGHGEGKDNNISCKQEGGR